MSRQLGLLCAVLGLALAGCEGPASAPVLEGSPKPASPLLELDRRAPTRIEQPRRFTAAPFIALTTIERQPPPAGQPWPPPSARGMIHDLPVWVSEDSYWRASPVGWVVQSHDLAPARLRTEIAKPEASRGRVLGVVGDQLIVARGSSDPRAEPELEIVVALVDALDSPWTLCTLRWPRWALQGERGPWHEYAGPALVDDELVILAEGGLLRASILDGVTRFQPTEHETRALTPGREHVAWRRQEDGHGHWSLALEGFDRVVHLPYGGLADWAGDSLILEHEGGLLRWTEDEITKLEIPGSLAPSRARRWFADGELLWIYEPGQPLWRFDGEGFVALELALDWPRAVRAQAGVLLWSLAHADHVELRSSVPGVGLGLDRAWVEHLGF